MSNPLGEPKNSKPTLSPTSLFCFFCRLAKEVETQKAPADFFS
jgi:hypothetical protein